MTKQFVFQAWDSLSVSEQKLVQTWVALTLKADKIRNALVNHSNDLDFDGIIDEEDAFEIISFSENLENVEPLDSIAPEVVASIMQLKQTELNVATFHASTLSDPCSHLTGEAKKKCQEENQRLNQAEVDTKKV